MSWHTFAVYGDGHLATTLRCSLTSLSSVEGGHIKGEMAFIAQDVLDHADEGQLARVARLFDRAVQDHQFVVILSQVPPGWTRKIANGRLGVYYQVDTIIMRRAVERMIRPEQIIIGCADLDEPLPLAYQEYLAPFECPILQMSYESAELAKCAINYFLAVQIRTANALKHVADRVGAEYNQVARALAGDARIGSHAYLRPGTSNQHLDRDVTTILELLGAVG